ncbi:hypothetical protein BHE74_00020548, partial [Ensete ventricosum]
MKATDVSGLRRRTRQRRSRAAASSLEGGVIPRFSLFLFLLPSPSLLLLPHRNQA